MNKEICKNVENLFTSTIYPNCNKKRSCANGQPDFSIKPKMPYIGREYGNNPQIPNLLFISLDSGNPGTENNIEEIRNSVENNPPRLNPGEYAVRHWNQTFEIASFFLDKYINESIKKENFYTDKYFAHTNSAKCSQNKKHRAQADNRLFDNCREFVVSEIPLFNADIIITQGNKACDCLSQFKKIGEPIVLETIHNGKEVKFPIYVREINNKKTIHIPMYHPSYYKGYWGQKTAFTNNLKKIVDIIQNIKN
ncbi:MAG: hypothetical protein NTZ33_05185 [Bacteroidetes bacterium]|nr:hypothetical protein [Bacteroidota bacterium]